MRIVQARRVDVNGDNLLQIMPYRNLARLSALLGKVEQPLLTRVIEIAALEFRDGSGARAGVDEYGQDGAVREPVMEPILLCILMRAKTVIVSA